MNVILGECPNCGRMYREFEVHVRGTYGACTNRKRKVRAHSNRKKNSKSPRLVREARPKSGASEEGSNLTEARISPSHVQIGLTLLLFKYAARMVLQVLRER